MNDYLMYGLRMVKLFFDIGIYEKAVGDIEKIDGDDYCELFLRGIEHVAPIFDREDLGENVCCGGHIMYHFSDPALIEYYRLCRLYEHGHAITLEENPFVKKADEHYIRCCWHTSGNFGTDYDNQAHPREIWIETCSEKAVYEHELIMLVHYVMEFFRNEVEVLRSELLRGPVVWLPALPVHTKQSKRFKKPHTEENEALKKAG